MLKRIYIDNFRNLVNFELSLDAINLFLGENGAGKSSVFDVLRKIQAFVIKGDDVEDIFAVTDCTRWQKSSIQRFELDIEDGKDAYQYKLAVDFSKDGGPNVHREELWHNDYMLLKFEAEQVQLHSNYEGVKETRYPFNGSYSAIASLPPTDNALSWFKKQLARFVMVQVNPMMMTDYSKAETQWLSGNAENFVSWYRYLSQDQGTIFELTDVLKEVLDGFKNFKFARVGEEQQILRASFVGTREKPFDYNFSELSDGQRVLVALYTLLYGTRHKGYTLCIDEPENFLALREIQPWLTMLYDFCNDGEIQALLISHHPELIDYLAKSAGYWFDCQSNYPVRVKRIADCGEDNISISKLVARGWLYD